MFTNNINLREEFNDLLDTFGINVLYFRTSSSIKCNCYDELYKVGDSSCINCAGTGKLILVRLVKTIKKTNNGELSYHNRGFYVNADTSFYFPMQFTPKINDYLVIAEFDTEGVPRRVINVFEINYVNTTRGDNGKIEMFRANVDERADKIFDFDNIISKIPHSTMDVLMNGGVSFVEKF